MISESYLKIAGGCAAGRRMISDFASGDSGQSYLFASTDTLLCECIATAAVIAENGERVRRRIVSGLCGDVLTLGENGFRAEDADTVISACRLSPAELKRRAFLLILGDTNDAAQNKLLKTLEEAPERSVFFVIAPSVKSVLPTIASRLEVIEPDAPDVESAFAGETEENLPYALYGGGHDLTEFDALLSGRKTDALMRAVRLAGILGPSARMLEATELIGDSRSDMKDTLMYFERIMGDVMRCHGGVETQTYGLFNIKTLAEKFPLNAMPEVLRATREAVSRTATGNRAAIADMFVITVSEVMYYAKSSGR